MSGAREGVTKGLHLGLTAIRHTGWWLRWQTGPHACREVAELGVFPPRTVRVERPAA